MNDTITIDLGSYSDNDYQIYTSSDTISYTNQYTVNGVSGSDFNWSFSDTSQSGITVTEGDLKIEGDGDLKIGDRSIKEFMDKVEKRLAILNVNQELEAQWEELKALGDKYRELEEQLIERNKIMDILKEK